MQTDNSGQQPESSRASSANKSMFHSKTSIEAGDLSRDNMTAITITPGEVIHNKYGRYVHDDLIGQKFGTKLHSPPPHAGYVHLLRPTPELWTLSLPHRTQILYLPDISYITMRLGVRVGGKVIEAGTGSGSMTHSLSRTVGPLGKVFSFEYHQPRYEKALEEFASHGLDNVHLQHRNVCKDGFSGATDVEGVFLDLPAPWEAIPHAMKTLRPDIITKICCFSPCLEQVLKTVSTLRSEGFSDIFTQEVLIRTHELVKETDPDHLNSVSSIIDRLKAHEKRKVERRAVQMKTAREKIRRQKGGENATAIAETTESSEAGQKRKLETDGSKDVDAEEEEKPQAKDYTPWTEPETQLGSAVLTKPTPEMKGHTSYLTFASFYPESVRNAIAAQDSNKTAIATPRLAEIVAEGRIRAGSQETEYGSDGLDEVMGTLTEEEMIALAGQ
ncbi:hypothetical protein I302_101818 [Kwoniella bestiolae CBS 10118]|uniref:tRNA (adenine(58)-N(1))-methyltransferase catalytic subunit TRM61 n=1 Tax=Kwoniella bestiolae CBS 10118 TaxID=1296100 RepID=A0AAJ8K2X9_9TREE